MTNLPWKKIAEGCAVAWRGAPLAKWECDVVYRNVDTGATRTLYTHRGYIDRMPARVAKLSILTKRRGDVSPRKGLRIRQVKHGPIGRGRRR